MDICVHCLEYKADACPERLKYIKEQGILIGFQLMLMTNSQIDDKHCHLQWLCLLHLLGLTPVMERKIQQTPRGKAN